MPPLVLLLIYSVVVVLASLLGGWLPSILRLTHTRTQMMMSGVAGLMLGVALFHLLPHAVGELGGPAAVDISVWWTMIGLLAMFFLIRAFHFHQHGPGEPQTPVLEEAACDHEHDHTVEGGHHHHHDAHGHQHAHHLSWVGVAFGLSLHTIIDGVALGASVQAEAAHHSEGVILAGLGVFLAVLLHKPLDSLSITSLMAASGWSSRSQMLVNLAYASLCPLGALGFYFGVEQLGGEQQAIVGRALAFAAGVFLCISLGDLLPELQFHTHDRAKLSFALLLGIGLAYGIVFLEPEHVHHHGAGAAEEVHDHEHDHGHDHSHDHDEHEH